MSLLDAAESILGKTEKPLTALEISNKIIASGLWATNGKTPDATVGARLYMDIKQHGLGSRFQQTGKGLFALRAWGLPDFQQTKTRKLNTKVKVNPLPARTLSFTDATEEILDRLGDRKPMHYREITKRAIELGKLHSEGQTPEATLYAQVLTEIGRKTRRGETPRFVKHGKGYIGLSKWMGSGLAFQIEQHNVSVRKKLRTLLYSMNPTDFEHLVGELLGALGFEQVNVTRRSSDGGVDVRGTLVVGDVIRTSMAVQVKKWKTNVQAPIVQQVRGSLGTHEQGLIITTSDYSSGAREEAERPNAVPVALMNGEQLVALLVENNILVRRNSYDLLELGESEPE